MKPILFSLLALAGCSESPPELKQGVDPITGDAYELAEHEVGAWHVLTFPEPDSRRFAMLAKEGNPIVTAARLGGVSSLTIHDAINPNLTAVEIYDNDNDGIYDRLVISAQDGSAGFSELILTEQKTWRYVEHKEIIEQ